MTAPQLETPGRQDDLIHIGKVIARLREERGWSVKDLADRACVGVAYLSAYEEKPKSMGLAARKRIVETLRAERPLSDCDRSLLGNWMQGRDGIPSLREGVEAAKGPDGPGGGAHDAAAGTGCKVEQDAGRTGKPGDSAVPYGRRVTAGLELDRDLINRIWMQSIDRNGVEYRSWRGLVLENALTTLEERCQVGTAVAHGGKAGESRVILRDSVAIGALLEELGWDLVDLEMVSIVPIETCRAAQNREAVEVRLLDRMIVAIDERKPLRPSQWIDYLTQTFAIDGWDPERCLRLLSRAGFIAGCGGAVRA